MTITLQPDQEQAIQAAIRAGTFRTVDEFLASAIATLPKSVPSVPRPSRLWDLRRGLNLGSTSIRELIEEGRE